MLRRLTVQFVVALVLSGAWCIEAAAMPIQIGTGVGKSLVFIEFSDGNLFEFEVSYDGMATGEDLLNRMADETAFEFEGDIFDFGGGPNLFVYSMSFAGSSEGTFGSFETSPHYYVKDTLADSWEFSQMGASDRVVFDGSVDGWTFSEVTIPEPASLVLPMGSSVVVTIRPMRHRSGMRLGRIKCSLF